MRDRKLSEKCIVISCFVRPSKGQCGLAGLPVPKSQLRCHFWKSPLNPFRLTLCCKLLLSKHLVILLINVYCAPTGCIEMSKKDPALYTQSTGLPAAPSPSLLLCLHLQTFVDPVSNWIEILDFL